MKYSAKLSLVLISMITLPCLSTGVLALGAGPYVGGGSGTYDGDGGDLDYSFARVGFVLDSTVSEDQLFNYRLEIGYAGVYYDESDLNVHRLDIVNTFGFGVVRESRVRLWLGPQIGLYGGGGEVENNYDTYNYNEYGISIGPALGVNFHVGSQVSLALTLYARYGIQWSEVEDDYYGDTYSDSGNEFMGGLTFSLLFGN